MFIVVDGTDSIFITGKWGEVESYAAAFNNTPNPENQPE